jgi:hypothetical protein
MRKMFYIAEMLQRNSNWLNEVKLAFTMFTIFIVSYLHLYIVLVDKVFCLQWIKRLIPKIQSKVCEA